MDQNLLHASCELPRDGRLTMTPVLRCLAAAIVFVNLAGCSMFSHCVTGIPAIPAHRVPPEFLGRRRTEMQEITLSRLRQTPPKAYRLAANDILGVFIETVLGGEDEAPPVNFNNLDGSKPPALGFPIPVREDGTLALPMVEPIQVSGMTLTEATDAIRKAFTVDKKILVKKDRIIVTLQRPREYRVLVVREEAGGSSTGGGSGVVSGRGAPVGNSKRGMGANVQLPAYENDLLTALNQTGGLPGLDAKNEVLILRGNFQDAMQRDQLIAQLKASKDPCECELNLPEDVNVIRIPLRFYPENVPTFKEEDIILHTGDIVMVQSREREQYYMGGAIRGEALALPRDYDLDILQAVALAGGSVAQGGTGVGTVGGFGGGGGGGSTYRGMTPSRAIVLRKTCNGGEIPIKVDLRKAITSPGDRILIQPEDTIIIQYTFCEELYNAALQMIQFNFLLSGLSGRGI